MLIKGAAVKYDAFHILGKHTCARTHTHKTHCIQPLVFDPKLSPFDFFDSPNVPFADYPKSAQGHYFCPMNAHFQLFELSTAAPLPVRLPASCRRVQAAFPPVPARRTKMFSFHVVCFSVMDSIIPVAIRKYSAIRLAPVAALRSHRLPAQTHARIACISRHRTRSDCFLFPDRSALSRMHIRLAFFGRSCFFVSVLSVRRRIHEPNENEY